MLLFENYIEFESTRDLNILNRKAYPYKNKFDSFKMEFDNVSDEEEKIFRVSIVDVAFDHLGVSIKGKSKESTQLKDFIENRYALESLDSDWSALFVRCCFYNYIDKNGIEDDGMKSRIAKMIINPLKFRKGILRKEKEDILPGDVLVNEIEKDGFKFLHYSIFLYKLGKDGGDAIVCDVNVNKEGDYKKGSIHILKRKGLFNDPTFLGYYNLYSELNAV